jgi:hypothetical protein
VFTEADLQRQARVYAALPEYQRRWRQVRPSPGQPADDPALNGYEFQVLSQNGEDGVLTEIFRRIGVSTGTFVEFGVESGHEGICVALADIVGWHGLFMEADGEHHFNLHRKYQWNEHVHTVHALVTPERAHDLFKDADVPSEPDVLAIDIDGGDYWVWEQLTDYRPRVVVIEYNSALDPGSKLVQPPDLSGWDGSDFFGTSLGALVALAEGRGYRLVHCELAGVNAFFVREDQVGEFLPADQVQRRGPNYFLTSHGHPAATRRRSYVQA